MLSIKHAPQIIYNWLTQTGEDGELTNWEIEPDGIEPVERFLKVVVFESLEYVSCVYRKNYSTGMVAEVTLIPLSFWDTEQDYLEASDIRCQEMEEWAIAGYPKSDKFEF
jgi:hypothetical protein